MLKITVASCLRKLLQKIKLYFCVHLLKGCEPLTVTVSEQRTFDGGYVGFGLFMSFLTNNNKKAFYITNHTIQPPYSLTSSNCSYKVLVQGNLRFVLVFLHVVIGICDTDLRSYTPAFLNDAISHSRSSHRILFLPTFTIYW